MRQISSIAILGPYFGCRRSLFGPYFCSGDQSTRENSPQMSLLARTLSFSPRIVLSDQVRCRMGFGHCQHLCHLPCQQDHVQVQIYPETEE